MKTYSETAAVPADPEKVFSYVDDHARFSSHMNKSSWMMGGGRMDIAVDPGRGQTIGSHIRMSGKAFGISLSLDEVITAYEPPRLKSWETVGTPRLLVVGRYRMSIYIEPQKEGSLLTVSIGYELPETAIWLGRIFGPAFARWCVGQMVGGVKDNFKPSSKASSSGPR